MVNASIMRKILFPFELDNPVYREAYIHAIKFARKIKAELILLHVFQVEVGNDITKEKFNRLKRDNWFKAYNEISRFSKYYLEDHARVETDLQIRFDYRFVHGNLSDEIKNIAMEEEVDLIVLPLSEKKEFNKRQMKIIRDNVFERNRTSLLVIPHGCNFRPVGNIVFATDLKLLFNYQKYINDIVTYARLFDSSVHFIHVSSKAKAETWDQSDTYKMITQVLSKDPRYTFHSLHGKSIIESVNQYVAECQADLLVVVRHQNHFLESIFQQSVSKEISLVSNIPVLVMREKRN